MHRNNYTYRLKNNEGKLMGRDKNGLYILRASYTDKSGVKRYARDYGLRCFKIYIKLNK